MKIVQLENHVLNYDRLFREDYFSDLGEYVSYDRTKPEEVEERAKDAEILFINKTVIGKKLIARLPKLKYIGVFATGVNVVDLAACREAGITVTNVPAYSTHSVVELIFSHIFNLARGAETHARGDWTKSPDFCMYLAPQREIYGLTMGIYGFGAIGRSTALAALAFGMKVIVCTRTPSKIDLPGIRAVSREEFFRESDIAVFACPLTPDTAEMVNEKTLGMMKKTAFLINTGRGGLVNEQALADALRNGTIEGAGLDVLAQEPPSPDCPLLNLPNCRITPHIGWATREARIRLMDIAKNNLASFLAGKPVNVVS